MPASRMPTKRIVDIRSMSFALAGPEAPYPVYQFSGRRYRYEYPGHNPFGLPQGNNAYVDGNLTVDSEETVDNPFGAGLPVTADSESTVDAGGVTVDNP